MIVDSLNAALALQGSPFSAEMQVGRLVFTLPRNGAATLEQIQAARRVLQRSGLGSDTFVALEARDDISDSELHRALAAEDLAITGVSRRVDYPGLVIIQAKPGSSAAELATLAARAAVVNKLPPRAPGRKELEAEAVGLEKELAAIQALGARGVDVAALLAPIEARLTVLAQTLSTPPGGAQP